MNHGTFFKSVLWAAMLAAAPQLQAQTTGQLYDPMPPADSAYVRVINVPADFSLNVLVDGKERVKKLAGGTATDYMVIPAGSHRISLKEVSGGASVLDEALEVTAGRSMTLAFEGRQQPLRVFSDKANTNKAKAVLCAYHLAPRAPALDVRTDDDKLTVFPALAAGSSKCLNVNPIKVSLKAVGQGTASAMAALEMDYGGTYALWILPDKKSGIRVSAQVNKVERYTEK